MASESGPPLRNLKAIIFDYGEVLCLPPTTDEVAESARILDLDVRRFRELWSRDRDRYDRGDFTAEQYWRMLAENAKRTLREEQFRELAERDVRMWSHVNPLMVAWLGSLSAAGIKTAVLSNMHADMARYARREFAWLDLLSYHVFSVEVRLINPDPAIYRHCLQGLGVAAQETLFLDDRGPNVKAAQAVGLHALRFKSVAQLHDELQAAGFPVLPRAAEG